MIRKAILSVIVLLAGLYAQAQNDYYFGNDQNFDSSIPTPEEFFGFPIGNALVRYDKVVEYFKVLAEKSDRASFQVIGHTHENRDYVILTITSPDNLKNLDHIRQQHLKLTDPNNGSTDYSDQKVIIQLGYNVHGGELAGTDASVLAAYYFVATKNPDIVKRLSQAVIFIEPALNPDGRERAAEYFNAFHSIPPVNDALDIEHTQSLLPLRGNHFFADLNRDWFSLIHPESRARANFYHQWYPNIYTDYHEMGRNSTYYFEPSRPHSTWNYTVPTTTYTELNVILAKYFGAELDKIGSLYFTKENFDNISPIYGSTYPDFEGGVGTTLEVGSSQGVQVESELGIHEFRHNIRDNVVTSIGALKAGTDNATTFFKHQQDFFKSAVKDGGNRQIVFGDKDDQSLTNIYLANLLRHHIKVYKLASDFRQGDKVFKADSAYVVPFAQAQERLVNAAFDEQTHFVDSIFMDITAWSTAHGVGIPFARSNGGLKLGSQVTETPINKTVPVGHSDLAYVFDYSDFYAPKVLYSLLNQGVYVKASYKEFTTNTVEKGRKSFGKGSIIIPVKYQTISADSLYKALNNALDSTGIQAYSLTAGGSADGIDLGSDNNIVVKKPVVATFVSAGGYFGIDWTEIGETWYLLGNRFNIPLVKIYDEYANRADLSRYTHIILVDGNYNHFDKIFIEKLKNWVKAGGVLITSQRASQWAIDNGIATHFEKGDNAASKPTDVKDTKSVVKDTRKDYVSQREQNGPNRIGGVIYAADLDITNPLAFGIHHRDFYSIKSGNYFLPKPTSDYASLLRLKGDHQVAGYLNKVNQQKLKNRTVVAFDNLGAGAIVLFEESPTFRGYWLSTSRFLVNSLFFGSNVSSGLRYRP